MAKTKKQCEDLPDLIEDIIPVWEKEIKRLNALPEPTNDDIHLSIKLAAAMMTTYCQFQVIAATVKAEAVKQSYKLTSQYQTKQQALNNVQTTNQS